ncbi:MAG: Ig-like domain-containing protein [Rikenellaceae bacterium]|nr:Ig-like domain-containing protein [Rikenellaceae bacterium]
MKQLLTFLFLLLVVSCKKDDKEPDIPVVSDPKLNHTSYSLKVPNTVQLTLTEGTIENLKWSSDDNFVATVSDNGLVTAQHVGTTIIRANELSCKITVSAQYAYYIELVTDWGMSVEDIMVPYKTPYDYEIDGNFMYLYYYMNNQYAPSLRFGFYYNELWISSILFDINYEENLWEFINERYKCIILPEDSESGSATFLINADTESKATTVICIDQYVSDYLQVDYMDISAVSYKSGSVITNAIERLRSVPPMQAPE